MQYRHEQKHEIDKMDMLILRQRLRAVMKPDEHASGGVYHIRSLYFDNLDDKALREKLDGVSVREKFRLRLYNGSDAYIRLECKSKLGELGSKLSVSLTAAEAQSIIDGDVGWLAKRNEPLLVAFYSRIRADGLHARTIVDYTREPFVYSPGNVRVTLDYGIRTGLSSRDFLAPRCPTIPIKGDPCLLEVKWDAYLPELIRAAVQLDGRKSTAFSKYAACRMYD